MLDHRWQFDRTFWHRFDPLISYFANSRYQSIKIEKISQGRKFDQIIMITCPRNEHPLTPHFYIVKMGFTGVYIFSYFCSKT